MKVQPDITSFDAAYAAGRPQVVWTTLVSDLETPVSAYMKLADGRPFGFLLESAERGAGSRRDRYSVIGFKPDVVWRSRGNKAEINRDALHDRDAFRPLGRAPLDELRALINESRIPLPEELPPMAAGLFGYMTYDMVRLMERLPDNNPDELNIPDAILTRPSIVAIFDSHTDSITLVTPVWPKAGKDAATAYADARERLTDALADLERPLPYRREPRAENGLPLAWTSNTTREEYHAIVEKAKEYIRAGDIFQVVPSQRIRFPFKPSPLALYRTLRRLNPSPFLFHCDFGELTVVGSSPEILVRVRDGKVTVRPIAGTRKRGATPAEDEALAADLLSDPKELAEHLMLLDLGRNDVGRVAKVGTVKVTSKMIVELYSHVMHIVSNVEGEGRRARRAGRRLPRRHGLRRAEGPRHGDHRRVGKGPPRRLCRLRRLFRRVWRHGHLHCAAHRRAEGRHDVCPGWRRRRCRQRPGGRISGDGQQVDGLDPRRRRDPAHHRAGVISTFTLHEKGRLMGGLFRAGTVASERSGSREQAVRDTAAPDAA